MHAASTAVFAIVALAALASPVLATSTSDEHFRACFSWDKEADNFAGGSDWYNRRPCTQWYWNAFAFAIPAVIGGFILAIFPCIFYPARILCNCCGGRHRTEGTCCSDVESRHRFPEYPNRSIFMAKVLFSTVFGAYVYYAVGGYVSNAKLHTDFLDVVNDFGDAVDGIGGMMGDAATKAASLQEVQLNVTPPVVFRIFPTEVVQGLKDVNGTFNHRVGEINHQLDNIRRIENDQQLGRAESVYRYPSCTLLVLFVALICMAFNLRKAMGPLMVLVCWTSVVVGVVFVPHMILAQGVQAMCANYNETVVPVAVGAIEQQNGCNSAAFKAGLADAAVNLEAQFWYSNDGSTNGPSSICSAMQTVCTHFNCSYNTCGGGSGVTGDRLPFRLDADLEAPYNVFAMQMVVDSPFHRMTGQRATPSPDASSINACALSRTCGGASSDVHAAAKLVAQYVAATYPQLSFLYDEALPSSTNCSAVRGFLHGAMHEDLCTGVNRRLTSVAMVLGVMYLLGFLALPVMIRGMKRFVAMKRNQSIADVARETVHYADARVNAVPYVAHEVTHPHRHAADAATTADGQPIDQADQSMRGYGGTAHVNGEPMAAAAAADGPSVQRMADASMRRRFGYHGGCDVDADAQRQPLVADTAAPSDSKPL